MPEINAERALRKKGLEKKNPRKEHIKPCRLRNLDDSLELALLAKSESYTPQSARPYSAALRCHHTASEEAFYLDSRATINNTSRFRWAASFLAFAAC